MIIFYANKVVILDEMHKFLGEKWLTRLARRKARELEKDLDSHSIPNKDRSQRAGPSDPRGLAFPLKERRSSDKRRA